MRKSNRGDVAVFSAVEAGPLTTTSHPKFEIHRSERRDDVLMSENDNKKVPARYHGILHVIVLHFAQMSKQNFYEALHPSRSKYKTE